MMTYLGNSAIKFKDTRTFCNYLDFDFFPAILMMSKEHELHELWNTTNEKIIYRL